MVWWALALNTHTTWCPSHPSPRLPCPCSIKPLSSLMSPASCWCTPPTPQTRPLQPPFLTRPCLLVHRRWTTGEILHHTHSTSTWIFTCRTSAAFNIDWDICLSLTHLSLTHFSSDCHISNNIHSTVEASSAPWCLVVAPCTIRALNAHFGSDHFL